MKIKNILKNKSTYMVIIFSLTILTISLCLSIFISKVNRISEINGSKNKSIFFNFEETNKVTSDEVLNELKNYNDIYLEYNPIPIYLTYTTIFGKGVYFDEKSYDTPPIIDGRYIDLNDIEGKSKVAVIGKNLDDMVQKFDNKDYIELDGELYEIIGKIGYENKKSAFDDQFIINMSSLDYLVDGRANIKLSSKSNNLDNIALNLSNNLNNNIVEKEPIYKVDFSEILSEIKDFINIVLTVIFIGGINIIILTLLWIDGYKKEFGVRKALGATNLDIVKKIVAKYLGIITISLGIASVLHLLVKGILDKLFPYLSFSFSIINMVLITIISLIIGLLVSILPIIKCLKIEPIVMMKGGK